MMSAAERWSQALAAWAIPHHILDGAPESPWGFSTALFARRADAATETLTPSNRKALEALPDGGVVLDVGCGAGAASLPLARKAGHLTGVDPSAEMLEAFRARAQAAGTAVTTLEGAWPAGAMAAPAADVVVCHHVAYNAPDLATFALRLADHARYRVVMEMTALHPMSRLNDLWLRFHGLVRPATPTVDDAIAVLRELGFAPEREEWASTPGPFTSRADLVAMVRRQLCLTPERDPEIEAALAERLLRREDGTVSFPSRTLVALWWDGTAARSQPS